VTIERNLNSGKKETMRSEELKKSSKKQFKENNWHSIKVIALDDAACLSIRGEVKRKKKSKTTKAVADHVIVATGWCYFRRLLGTKTVRLSFPEVDVRPVVDAELIKGCD
jgi:hypothetical protein